MTCKEEKKRLRKEVVSSVRTLSPAYCRKADEEIRQAIKATDVYKKSRAVFIFVGTEWEIQTYPLIEDMWADGKIVGVPLCVSKGFLEVRRITKREDLEKGNYGLWEPRHHMPLIKADEIDLAIIPCCTCNAKGQRLGYGAGYYDRYLQNASFPTIVLCRRKTMRPVIPCEEHDVRIDQVITDSPDGDC